MVEAIAGSAMLMVPNRPGGLLPVIRGPSMYEYRCILESRRSIFLGTGWLPAQPFLPVKSTMYYF